MEIEFLNDKLARIVGDDAHKMGLSPNIIRAARKTLYKLELAPCEKDLYRIGGLDYKLLRGIEGDIRQVRINQQYRIFFTISGEGLDAVIMITFIGDPH